MTLVGKRSAMFSIDRSKIDVKKCRSILVPAGTKIEVLTRRPGIQIKFSPPLDRIVFARKESTIDIGDRKKK